LVVLCAYAHIRISRNKGIRVSGGGNIMSPRPRKGRFCVPFSGDAFLKPRGIPLSELQIIDLGEDELEAMRLCDFEEMEQEEAAKKMNISRGTIQRLLYSGRKKVVDFIINSKALKIIGGGHIMPAPFFGKGRHRRGFCR
jgi:predicted DNA-binding protein (UPF0251 family)